ncbi:MAG: SIR2 family protein [Rhodospirillales bacterium]|nr:SIR2 family protein [Rhodospirillales bacterium]
MADEQINAFLASYSEEVDADNAAVFAGAGLSRAAGFVDWKLLLKSVALSLDLDIEKEINLVALAQYYCNARLGSRGRINKLLLDKFARDAEITDNHRILARLPISTYWTTNYDRLIERSLEDAGKRPDVKYTVEQLALTVPHRDAVVYKMHGDISEPSKTVLIKDDYEKYHVSRGAFITALTGDLVSKTFLFLGFSFSDPNIDYVLSRIRAGYDINMRTHYCFMKRLDERDFPDKETLAYKSRQQALFINDLLRFNVETLLLDSYARITEILEDLERIYRSKSVFISGAAHEWGPGWPTERARAFVRGLSKTLVNKNYRLVSGFGYGVGSAVIAGALQHIYATKRGKMEDQLILRPFPHDIIGTTDWEDVARRYREDMANYAGAAVFLFGNKLKDGQVVKSDGVAQEFDVCKEKGLAVIPVGATGSMAAELYKTVMDDFATYFPKRTEQFKPLMQTLGDSETDAQVLIDTIIRVLELWAQG